MTCLMIQVTFTSKNNNAHLLIICKNPIFSDRDSLKLCFMHLVQKDLDLVKKEWNCHPIRPSKNTSAPSGRPDELYQMPQILGMY